MNALRDDLPTLVGVCVLAYLGETLGHEVLGHGVACLASGGKVTALAPLWMRCTVQTRRLVAAGPAFNFIAAGVYAAILHFRTRWSALNYFLWMSCAFNGLVACGYLVVGGATTFGDWGFVFASVQPSWSWRLPAIACGVFGYWIGLRVLGHRYFCLLGVGGSEPALLARRTMAASVGAAFVAVAAEIAGGRSSPAAMVLPIGCTFVVGWSLMLIGGKPISAVGDGSESAPIGRDAAWILAALAMSGGFIFWVGPVIGSK